MNSWKLTSIILGILLAVSIMIHVIGAYSFNNLQDLLESSNRAPAQQNQQATEGRTKGPSSAQIELIEYADFECPYCSRVEPTLQQLMSEYPGKIRITFEYFPLSFHQHAFDAALAAECANEQGQFWPYHDALFANQAALRRDDLISYAGRLSLDKSKFTACLDSQKYASVVNRGLEGGKQAGVTGTPTFLINGNLLVGAQPIETFRQVIDSKLN